MHAPDGSATKLCVIAVCHAADDPDRAEADVRPLRALGRPVVDQVGRMPYPLLNTLLDPVFGTAGALNYWKSAFFSELSDAAVEVMVSAYENAPTETCAVIVEQFHGAVTRVDHAATAFPHREPGYNLNIAPRWTDPEQTDSCIAWARETFDALRPHMANRSYVNYLAADDDDRVRQAYGANYDRLVELKRRYDPNNLFRLTLNIDPKGRTYAALTVEAGVSAMAALAPAPDDLRAPFPAER
jgi:FAD/FMN-containing dehydrogenase